MDSAESRVARLPRRRPISLRTFMDVKEGIIELEVWSMLVQSGVPEEKADKLAKDALRRAKRTFDGALPDVTRQDLKSIKIRRSP